MHIYFSGIGGTGIGPLALIAQEAGYTVSGSDKQDSSYLHYLAEHGIHDVHIGQNEDDIAKVHAEQPIDWFVYSSAIAIENPDAPELQFCRKNNIKMSQRDELLNEILSQKNLKLIAIAGTHGKTTTTAMTIWLCKQLAMPISYAVGAKLSFGDMGHYDPASQYFIYEADEFARNFLSFDPELSIITGVDWDHPDIYPTREDYEAAFRQFASQSRINITWQSDAPALEHPENESFVILDDDNAHITEIALPGAVNRRNAWQVATAIHELTQIPLATLLEHLEKFPGVSRRFEQVAPGIYSDYAHTPPKIRGALQLAHEVAGANVVVVYEGLHNTRQHFIRDELVQLFDGVKQLYIVPSYLAREDPNLPLLSPQDLKENLSSTSQVKTMATSLSDDLAERLRHHQAAGDLVLCLSAGGGGSLHEWTAAQFQANS